MKFKVNAGVDIETTTPGEMRGMLDSSQKSWFAEMARGVKHFRFGVTGDVSAGSVTINSILNGGPNAGFVWAIQRLSVDSLAAGDTLRLYRGDPGPNTFIDLITDTRPTYKAGSRGLILHGGEDVKVTGAGLTTTAPSLTVNGEALEVPEFMIWKLL